MKELVASVDAWHGARMATATVVEVRRSAPRPPGAKMVINDRGQIVGAVSGGCVEGAVVEAAQEVLAGAPPRRVSFGIADEDAWDVGLPCGGEIGVWIQADPHEGFVCLAREDRRGALVTDLDSGERWLLEPGAGVPEGLPGWIVAAAQKLMWSERAELVHARGREMFIDVTFPAPRILIVGAIDFACQLCNVSRAVGWRPL